MFVFQSTLLSTALNLAAVFLALSILVQVLQELYKYMTSSKSRAYSNILRDYLGIWATELLQPGKFLELKNRGPFQLMRISPNGPIHPLTREELAASIEKKAPYWVRQAIEALNREITLAGSKSAPSPFWDSFLTDLATAQAGKNPNQFAEMITDFLKKWGHTEQKDNNAPSETDCRNRLFFTADNNFEPAVLLAAVKEEFLPHLGAFLSNFDRMNKNFEFAYRRRNLRQTLVIALLMAMFFNLPFNRLAAIATHLSPDESERIVSSSLDLYQKLSTLNDTTKKINTDSLRMDIMNQLIESNKNAAVSKPLIGVITSTKLSDLSEGGISRILKYIFNCLLTAVLICFGAPFWNDLAGVLIKIPRQRSIAGKEQ